MAGEVNWGRVADLGMGGGVNWGRDGCFFAEPFFAERFFAEPFFCDFFLGDPHFLTSCAFLSPEYPLIPIFLHDLRNDATV